jgi:hypothetical protein
MKPPVTLVRLDHVHVGVRDQHADPDGNPVDIILYDHRAVERAWKR